MNGPIEYEVFGSLHAWDREADLSLITNRTLVTVGGYDLVPLRCSQTLAEGIAGAQLVLFEKSGHMSHEEEPERYVAAVSAFLDD